MAIYAGFVFPWRFIQDALLKGGGNVAAVPLDAAGAPPNTHVGYFEMHPSFAYAKVLLEREALRRRAESAAMTTLSHRGLVIDTNTKIEDLKLELRPPSLADRGVVLLPCFVCKYTHNNVAGYECYISGINANVGGLETHPPGSLFGGSLSQDWRRVMRNMKFFERRHDEYRDFSCTAAEYDFWEGEMARVKAGVEPWRHEEATHCSILTRTRTRRNARRKTARTSRSRTDAFF